jgi:hypothetical protein
MCLHPCTLCIYEGKRDGPLSRGLERHKDSVMEAFATWKTILMNELRMLKQLRGLDDMSLMRYAMKDQDFGLHCYQAEESLTDAEGSSCPLYWHSSPRS